MGEGERAEIKARLADIEGAWWGVHTSEEFHANGTSTMRYHAVHRHAGEHIGYLVETVRALEAREAALVAALARVGQLAHAQHGGRGSFRWCGESACQEAYRAEHAAALVAAPATAGGEAQGGQDAE